MANSDDVTSSREILKIGDIAYKRANSEAIMSRFAATNNFIHTYQTDSHRWCLNGSYSVATGIELFDGLTSFFYNAEIVGIYFWNGQAGVSGTTDFDIRWQDVSGVDQGSIFSVTPKIDSTATNTVRGFESYVTGNSSYPTGVTQPTLSKTTFLEGESIYMKLNSSMVSAKNCGIAIHWRPIN